MKELFTALYDALGTGQNAVTVVVTACRGSTPRSPGAMMLVRPHAPALGTVGGGQAEYDAALAAKKMLAEGAPHYSEQTHECLSAEELARMGKASGGEVTLLYLLWQPERLPLVQQILAALLAGEDATLQFCCPSAGWEGALASGIREETQPGRFAMKLCEGGRCYIFGGGHVSHALVPLLGSVGFSCVVLDERPEYANQSVFPTAAETLCGELPRLARGIPFGSGDSILIMTRGHQGDYAVLCEALRSPVWYLGMVGSRRKMEATFDLLRSDGFTAEDLARVVTPIGLSIDAETPQEIAVSIAAQMIQKRAAYRRIVTSENREENIS